MFDSPELIELNLSNNNLSGEIPFEWGDLNIVTIILSNNQLTGEITGMYMIFEKKKID